MRFTYSKLLVLFIIVYAIFIASMFQLTSLDPDEGTHLLLSLFYHDLTKFVINNGFSHAYDFAINYLVYYPKLTVYYPPLYHFLVSLLFNITISEIVGKIVTLLFSIGIIILTYKIGEFLFSQKVGFISAILLALSPVMIKYSSKVLVDIPVFFFFMLTFWLYLMAFKTKKNVYYTLASVSLALGLLTKWYILPLIPLLFFYLVIERKFEIIKKYILSLLLTLIIVSPYLILSYKLGLFELAWKGAISVGIKEGEPQFTSIGGWLFYSRMFLHQLSIPISLLAFASFIWLIIKRKKNWKLLFVWIIVIYITFTMVQNKGERYTIVYLPAFLYSLSYSFDKFVGKKNYFIFILILLIVVEMYLSYFYYLPRFNYPVDTLAKIVYENPVGNVAFVSEGSIYTSSFMFKLAELDRNRTIVVYRPCVFYNNTEDQIQQFLKENNIYYLISIENEVGYENFEKVKNITIKDRFSRIGLYVYNGFENRTNIKKCNYVCLTEQKICLKEW